MHKIYLHGALRARHGACFRLHNIATPSAAVRYLVQLVPGFRQSLAQGAYQLINGPQKHGTRLGETELNLPIRRTMHIIPKVVGGKNGGIGKIILGTALLAAAFVFAPPAAAGAAGAVAGASLGTTAFLGITYGNIALIGGAMALSGVSQLFAPVPKSNFGKKNPDKQSILYSGPTNTYRQGAVVPVVMGEIITGSQLISVGFSNEDVNPGAKPVLTQDPGSAMYFLRDAYTAQVHWKPATDTAIVGYQFSWAPATDPSDKRIFDIRDDNEVAPRGLGTYRLQLSASFTGVLLYIRSVTLTTQRPWIQVTAENNPTLEWALAGVDDRV